MNEKNQSCKSLDYYEISDDEILSLWRTVRPSEQQNKVMTYQTGPYDYECPIYALRHLIELSIKYTPNSKDCIQALEEENRKLKKIIQDLHRKISLKNRLLNKSWQDHCDDCTHERDERP